MEEGRNFNDWFLNNIVHLIEHDQTKYNKLVEINEGLYTHINTLERRLNASNERYELIYKRFGEYQRLKFNITWFASTLYNGLPYILGGTMIPVGLYLAYLAGYDDARRS